MIEEVDEKPMHRITGNDILRIAMSNPDVTVPDVATGAKPAKRSKYGNIKADYEGIRFDSKAELRRYIELRHLQRAGMISQLSTQPVFLLPAGVKYKGDFRYVEHGQEVVEDVKGMETPVFKIKWKQVKELNPSIEFRIVR